jgi:hypothetical protein
LSLVPLSGEAHLRLAKIDYLQKVRMLGLQKQSLWLVAALSFGCGSTSSPAEPAASGGAAGGLGPAGTGGAAASSGSTGATSGAAATSGGSSNGGASANGGTNSGAGAGGSSNGGVGAGNAGSAGTQSAAGAGGGGGPQPFKGVANSPCAARGALNVSWYYNWTQKESDPCSDGTGGAFVPMIWGHTGAEQTASSIQSSVSGFVSKGYRFVLGFNEPDNATQANIAVATAVSLLPAFDNPGIAVGTPATSANAAGQTWFKDYMSQVAANANLRNDFIAIHWYGWNAGSCDAKAAGLESYLKYAEGFSGNRPIWLTEWGCLNQSAPDSATVVAFFKGALAVFAKHPRLVRYAWYPWSTNLALNNADGSLTELGKAYAAAPATK